MKLSSLAFLILLVGCCQSWAGQDDKRFVECPGPASETHVYDLKTVQMMQPGKFTIVGTFSPDPDVMRFELKVLDTLRTYCKDPDGSFAPSADLFTASAAQ
jgi:hypothetical protein